MTQGNRRAEGVSNAASGEGTSDRDALEDGPFTHVVTEFIEGRCNYRLLFGQPRRVITLRSREGWSRQRHEFNPGSRFALDLWRRNEYGTVQWRCVVGETLTSGEAGDSVPFVSPEIRVLLNTKGAAQSRLFLAWLAGLEEGGTDLLCCPSDLFEAAHFRLQGSWADRTPPRRLSGLL